MHLFRGILIGSTAAMALAAASAPARATGFTDATFSTGIFYLQRNVLAFPDTGDEIRRQTGGAAAGDVNGDGFPDVVVSRYGDTPLLYLNDQDGTFTQATSLAFDVSALPATLNGLGFGDVDHDGDLDLYATATEDTRYYLFINDGTGSFTEQALPRGAAVSKPDTHYGTSVAFGDYDRDGWLDLHTGEWRWGYLNTTNADHNARLLRNTGGGFFEDTTAAAGVEHAPNTPQATLWASRFSDLDGDHWPDLVEANDFLTSKTYWNNADGTFLDGTNAAGFNQGFSEMGMTVGDYDSDGDLDVYITNIDSGGTVGSGNMLYRNDGNRQFTEVSKTAGVNAGGWGWGTAFLDHDHDGDLDLIATNGQSGRPIDRTQFFDNDGDGTFTEIGVSIGVDDDGSGKGLLTFDYDRDGDLDVLIVNNAGAPTVYRNDADSDPTAGSYLQLDLRGVISNTYGVGAWVTVTPDLSDPTTSYLREMDGGSNFLAQSEILVHFGLGDAETVDRIEIRWPSGLTQTLDNVATNQRLTVDEAWLIGDVNLDGLLDASDIDELAAAINTGAIDLRYGMVDGSPLIEAADLDHLITALLSTQRGDANLDQRVDLIDLSALAASFGQSGGWSHGDFNTDGTVDLIDLSLLAANFGFDGNTAIPEPAGITLIALGALAVRRRRTH
ncbi:FG-GAP-like repeat-containing protein [Mucisphaera sp.]|uniref:FG-GAP-like repeat-containing protein n=1 Tax=Mucisphaera sp. TaxID=2913024 RepID=UPI003D0D2432